jgi:hypothetical protein
MKSFTLDEEYICDVSVVTYMKFENGDEPNAKELLNILKYGRDRCITSKDHDEFTKLRDQLEQEGYIKTQRNCWNGDTVLKPFLFNDKKFVKGERFVCGSAMQGHLKYMK